MNQQTGVALAMTPQRNDRPPREPLATAEATLAEAEMELSMGRALDDHLEGRLESIANDVSLPRALRVRALVNLSRCR